jgi:hypothetical protein
VRRNTPACVPTMFVRLAARQSAFRGPARV